MAVNARVLFDKPQQEIASLVRSAIAKSTQVNAAVGFATVEGIELLAPALSPAPAKLASLVLGASTFQGFLALDRLIALGVSGKSLFVHLGHTRPWNGKPNYFHKYHPMLHSKIILLDMPGDQCVAFVGSHNLTGFALSGLNGEAGIMLEGPRNDPEMLKVRAHVDEARRQAIAYDSQMKSAYGWWTTQFFDGLRGKSVDEPKDAENVQTIVILAATADGTIPRSGEVVYFELPEALGVSTMHADVHLFVFEVPPAAPRDALTQRWRAKGRFKCDIVGIELREGGIELQAGWEIVNRRTPMLTRTTNKVRPHRSPGMQQLRVAIRKPVESFEYLFDRGKQEWAPVYDNEAAMQAPREDAAVFERLDLEPPEHLDWRRVVGLRPREGSRVRADRVAESELSLEAESFILFSPRRIRLV